MLFELLKTVTLKDITKVKFCHFSYSLIICWVKVRVDVQKLHFFRNVWKLSSLKMHSRIEEKHYKQKDFSLDIRWIWNNYCKIVLYRSGHAKRPQDHQKIKLDCNSTHSLIPCSVCQFKAEVSEDNWVLGSFLWHLDCYCLNAK